MRVKDCEKCDYCQRCVRIDGLQKLVDINTERCEALRKQLREAHENYEKHLNELTTKCNQLQAAVDNYEKRIAELEAQLPKAIKATMVSSKECANSLRKFAEACKGVPYIE